MWFRDFQIYFDHKQSFLEFRHSGRFPLAAVCAAVPAGAGDDDPVVAALLVQQIALTRHFLEVQRRTHATYRRLLRSRRHAYVHRDDLKVMLNYGVGACSMHLFQMHL